MKIHNVAQGSAEWLELRLGLPTASQFHRIVTPAKCELSKQARKFAFLLIAEKLMHESFTDLDHLSYIARGKELEPQAVKMYEFDTETDKLSSRVYHHRRRAHGRVAGSADNRENGQAHWRSNVPSRIPIWNTSSTGSAPTICRRFRAKR